jgi:hypothetical protein
MAEQCPRVRGFASSFAPEGKRTTMKTLRNGFNLITPYQALGYAMEMVWLFLMRE